MVFIPSFEPVGTEESAKHSEHMVSKKQLKKIARVVLILQMSLAMGLEPVRMVGVTAQKWDAVT